MKIFFCMRHTGYVRLFDSVIEDLLKRGNEVFLGFMKEQDLHPFEKMEERFRGFERFDYDLLPKIKDRWNFVRKFLRRSQDYLRYRDPIYDQKPKLRKRASGRLPFLWRVLLRLFVGRSSGRIRLLIRTLRSWDRGLHVPRTTHDYLLRMHPDLLMITPLVDFGATQLDWFRAAKALGIQTALCVASWDNLTNKGLIQEDPDRVFVWNEAQKGEAMDYHHISASRICVTGAQCFDRWFDHQTESSKTEFCSKVGLSDRPYLLYLCSSPFIAPKEVAFVQNWIAGLRAHPNPRISQMNVLIRPHPQNSAIWAGQSMPLQEKIAIYPYPGAVPIDNLTINDYYDSIYYASGVVGLNTTAMLEAGILSKPVFTIMPPEFRDTQAGTLHFHHLLDGEWLHVSRDLEEHFQQLTQVESSNRNARLQKRFIQEFLRPHGLEFSSTKRMSEEILTMGETVFVA